MPDTSRDGNPLARTKDTEMLDIVMRAIEADASAAVHLPGISRQIAEAVAGFRETADAAPLAQLLSAGGKDGPELLWHVGNSADDNANALDRFTHQPALKQAIVTDDAITVSVGRGERVQLRVDWPDGDVENAELHLLVHSIFKSEPFFALRWLPAEGKEEVLLRFRPESLVFGRRVEYHSTHRANHQLLSVIRRDGADMVLLNGVPVIWKDAECGPLRGLVLDAIGSGDGENLLHIPFVMASRKIGPAAPDAAGVAQMLSQIISSCASKGELSAASGWLNGLAGVKEPIEREAGLALLAESVNRTDGYRDFLETLVLAKLDDEARAAAVDLLAQRPQPVLRLTDVAVKIDANPSKHASLRYLFSRRPNKVSLLDGVTFDAFNGDIVGIIGKNGAGKSTLLKTLVAAMPLARGRIECNDRPLLLRPGAGMQGDLTGRENLLKTGLYMGFLPHQMRDLMEDIIAFAELEDHIDRPFRYYSDGMRARLIFSLATAIPRDVLLLDELLSAGDVGFQRKAMARLDEFLGKARLVLVVQHTFDFVLSRCTKCLLLDHGSPVYFGDPKVATEIYREL
ncbi:ABC transporter ATP-binding protein [Hoeflea sp.]|uniref:ABC transporter ATP-binding protein n=1 Tax=Hoeflea sp. TaxID=1940281 RepID=UPI00374A3D0D